MAEKIVILPENQGQRLDKFLIEVRPEVSRSQIQKMIKTGQVLVEGRPAKVHRFLKTDEIVSFVETKISDKKNEAVLPPRRDSLPCVSSNFAPTIIFENPDFIVLEKPAGLLVHATDKGENNTLVDWLITRHPAIIKVGEEKYRAGIIHRLDKDVSGIMVVAKTNDGYFHLKDQFKQRKVKKEYQTLVYGHIKDAEGEIDLPIGRGRDGQFVAHPKDGKEKFQEDDRWARTKYTVIEYIKDYTLLSVQILTGRTHQIRAHLSAIGHPILGDEVYKPKKPFLHLFSKKIKVIELPRIFLHSCKIGFFDLDGQWQEFSSPLPEVLNDWLGKNRKK